MNCRKCDKVFEIDTEDTNWYARDIGDGGITGCFYPVCPFCDTKHEIEFDSLQVNVVIPK